MGKGSIGLWPTESFWTVFFLAASSFVTAVATQLYNIINLTVGASFNSSNQAKLFKLAGNVLFVALVLFVLTGLVTSGLGESNLAGIDLLLNRLSNNSEAYSIVVFGMVAVLISTADSGIMAISHLAYENVFNNDSHSKEWWA
jgi:hypothetical protein